MAEDNKIQYNLKDFENDLEENMENSDEQNYDLTNESNSFDGEKALDVTVHTADVLSKILAYLGVLAVLSYPIIHILDALFGMDKFMALLPLGYTKSSIPGTGDISGLMAFFALFCLYNGVRMGIWVAKSPSMARRIICIVIGVLFMVGMVSKEANDILLGCILIY